jgi:hypothetical protein
MEPEVQPSKEALHEQIESRLRRVETRLRSWTVQAQQENAAAEVYMVADLYVIADLLRQKLAIEQQLQELKTAPNPYWGFMRRVIDMDLSDLENALHRMEPKPNIR